MILNDAQRRAAEQLKGLVIVDAGAGSGKTRALTQRFANAVKPGAVPGWEPTPVDRIVAITFTDKAAGELAERIRETLRREPGLQDQARRVDVARISTIHGFCARLLKENALIAGIDPLFGVADTVQSGELAEEAFEAAARAAIERNRHAERLFADYGYAAVFSAVATIRRELIKRGRDASVLVVEETVAPAELLDEAIGILVASASELEGCDDGRGAVVAGIDACREVSERLRSLDPAATPSDEVGWAVWAELNDVPKGTRLSKGGAAEMLRALGDERVRLRQAALAVALQPMGEALLALAADYEGRFAEAKGARSLLDFDDLQVEAVRLLERHPDLASAYREQFSLVMVDEFQDTDSLQLSLIRQFSGPNLCTVGDERQSIYRFRGAEIEVYRQHRDGAIETGVSPIEFDLNYRSHGAVLDFVNRVFGGAEYFGEQLLALRHGREEPTPPVIPDGEPRIELVVVDRPSGTTEAGRRREAEEVATRFAELRDAGVDPAGMAVLVRAWTHADVFAAALRARGFAVIVGGHDFLTRPEVALVRSLMAVIANPYDEVALISVLASPLGGLSASALARLAAFGTAERVGLWNALLGAPEGLSEQDRMALARVVAAVQAARQGVGARPLEEVVLRAVTDLGYDLVLLSEGLEGKQRFVNVLKVARLAGAFEATGQTGMAGFVEHLDAKERLGDQESIASLADDGSPAVRIMTIHGAKGLEFPVVAVVGLADQGASDRGFVRAGWQDGRLRVALKAAPGEKKDDVDRTGLFDELDQTAKAGEHEEDKRLAYVAATRAREYLLLSSGEETAKLPLSDSMLARSLRALGLEVEPGAGADVAVDASGLLVRLRTVAAAPLDVVEPEAPYNGPILEESDVAIAVTQAAMGGSVQVPDVSFSSLKTYLTCPRRYWTERVARMGWIDGAYAEEADGSDGPTGNDPLAFGSAVHLALKEHVESGARSDERFAQIGRLVGLGAGEATRLRQAVEAVLSSAAMAEAAGLGLLRAEVPFTQQLGDGVDAVRLGGAIDLYARDERRALILDYKTGTSGGPDEVRERYGLQARCYALAALADGAECVEVLYLRPEVDAEGDIETTRFGPFTPADRPALEAEVIAITDQIRAGAFPATPSGDACRGCSIPAGLCPEGVR